jgi:hypothetical protein
MKDVPSKILLVIILLLVALAIPQFYPTGVMIYFRLALLVWILQEIVRLFKAVFFDTKTPKAFVNFGIVVFSLLVVFIVLEAAFMFIPRSHGSHYSLAAKLWLAKYWKPINSYGFRDKEPRNSKNVIFFVGDSFTAGHGLKSINDRFPNIVERELLKKGIPCSVVNIAENGDDTLTEFRRLNNFYYLSKIKPTMIVLQYFGNDIEEIAQQNGIAFEGFHPPKDMNSFLLFVGSGSYLVNYIYWLYPREKFGQPYINFLKRAYHNDIVFGQHKENLMNFIHYARQNSIPLIVVVFPFIQDLEMSDEMYVNDIVRFFEYHHVPTINVSPLIKDIPLKQRIINANDAHASLLVHQIVAKEILKVIDENKLISD